MVDYELRAEQQPADPVGQEIVVWHIARRGNATALCGHFFPLVSDTKPIVELHTLAPECLCPACSDWWSAVEQVWVEGSPREPEP
jgi:hypothetical protein